VKRAIDRRVAFARTEAEAARETAIRTVAELRYRLDPRIIASDATEQAWEHLGDVIGTVTEKAKARPWLLAAAATVAGLVITRRATAGPDETQATNP